MNSGALLAKAKQALESADVLLNSGDYDATANRAYYAMRHAARAALLAVGQPDAAAAKTHSGLISVFSLHLIKPGVFEAGMSRMLASASALRLFGDYDDMGLDEGRVRSALSDAKLFVERVNVWLAGREQEG